MATRKVKVQRSSSNAGYHFYNLYQCCERKFFLRLGPPRLEPMFVATPLLVGGAFHAGKALFYKTGKERLALTLLRDELKDRKRDFESRDEYLSALDRAPAMLASWIAEYGHDDLKHLDIIDVEREIKVPFPGRPAWHFTMRLDMIAKDRFDNLLIYETKTSSWSVKSTLINIQLGDQVTGYWWGAEKQYKRKVTAVVPDITYFSRDAKDHSAIKNYRSDFVYREPQDIQFFSRSMVQKASEIGQKMKAVYNGHDPALFSRNGYYCNAYNRPCEFADICRMNLGLKSKVPTGFRKRAGKFRVPEIFEPVEDVIAGG
jgi:hypothetical protein